MSNAEIVRQIEIYNLAVESAISRDYLAPSGRIVIDCLHNVWRDWILNHRRERHQKVDWDIACLEGPRQIEHVVSSLRVADYDQRTSLAGRPFAQDRGDRGRPSHICGDRTR